MPAALIIGHEGQDGACLRRLLREKGCAVAGTGRETVDSDLPRLKRPLDLGSDASVREAIEGLRPDEIYFLAAFHHSSEEAPVRDGDLIAESFAVNVLAFNRVLAAVAEASPASRVFYASSSRVFGEPAIPVQDENTPLNPVCAYGISKAAGTRLCRYYRDRGVAASCGILYNHESPWRSPRFVSRKVVRAAVRISRGSREKLVLGDLNAQVDWGYAPDYMEAAWRILQLEQPGDFVVGTGILHSVRELVETAFGLLGLEWRDHVIERGASLNHPAGRMPLCADSRKLRALTGWQPRVGFEQMIRIMIEAEDAG